MNTYIQTHKDTFTSLLQAIQRRVEPLNQMSMQARVLNAFASNFEVSDEQYSGSGHIHAALFKLDKDDLFSVLAATDMSDTTYGLEIDKVGGFGGGACTNMLNICFWLLKNYFSINKAYLSNHGGVGGCLCYLMAALANSYFAVMSSSQMLTPDRTYRIINGKAALNAQENIFQSEQDCKRNDMVQIGFALRES